MFILGSSLIDSIGLIAVFFVAFPLLLHGILGFIAAQVMGEKRANDEYAGHRAGRDA